MGVNVRGLEGGMAMEMGMGMGEGGDDGAGEAGGAGESPCPVSPVSLRLISSPVSPVSRSSPVSLSPLPSFGSKLFSMCEMAPERW